MKTVIKNFDTPAYTIDPTLKSYADSPFVQKKLKRANEIIKNLKNPLQ